MPADTVGAVPWAMPADDVGALPPLLTARRSTRHALHTSRPEMGEAANRRCAIGVVEWVTYTANTAVMAVVRMCETVQITAHATQLALSALREFGDAD